MRACFFVLALSLTACSAGLSRDGTLPDGGATAAGGTGTGNSTGTTGGGTTGDGASGVLFSPYKDVTINANWNTLVLSTALSGSSDTVLNAAPEVKTMNWAFATGECGAETWGGIAAADLAAANVPAWQSAGKNYILSTGGAAGTFPCGSDAGFFAFLDRYASPNLVGVDFDIEGGQTAAQIDDLVARVKAAQANEKYANLRFSFTIASLAGNTEQSLSTLGVQVMTSIQTAGLRNAVINLMTMDYGSASPMNCTMVGDACDMGQSAVQAAKNLNAAYDIPFTQIALTPMIGGNDTQGETFTLDDVPTVAAFVKANKLAGVHIWSLDRDKDCPPGTASATCNSYGSAGPLGFTHAFLGNL